MWVFWCFKPMVGWGKQFSRLSHKIGPFSLGIRASLGKRRRGHRRLAEKMGATSQSWARRGGAREPRSGTDALAGCTWAPAGEAVGWVLVGRGPLRGKDRGCSTRPSSRQATRPAPGRPGQCLLTAAAGRAQLPKQPKVFFRSTWANRWPGQS